MLFESRGETDLKENFSKDNMSHVLKTHLDKINITVNVPLKLPKLKKSNKNKAPQIKLPKLKKLND